MDRQVDRAVLLPGELVGAGAAAEDRLFAEGVDRDPPEVVAAGAGELRRSAARAGSGTGRRSWRTGPRRGRRPRSPRRSRPPRRPPRCRCSSAGLRESSQRPPGQLARRGARPSAAPRRASRASATPPSRISSTVTPWSTAAWLATLSARLRRACTASTAGSAPSAPIASVASSQSRSRERAISAAGGDDQREQPAARVGEVEGEQDRRHRRDREPAQRRPGGAAGSSRAAARPRSRTSPRSRSSSRAGSAGAGPLPSEFADLQHVGQEAAGEAEQGDERERRSPGLQRNVGAFRRFGRSGTRQGRSRGRPGRGPPRSRSARPTPTRGMRLQTAATDRRSAQPPSRAAVPASPARPRRGPAGRPRPAIPRDRRCDGRSRRSRLRPAPGRRSGRLERAAPRFALTLRAMIWDAPAPAHASGRSIFALSVLALLALACFPVLAHADSSGVQYSDAPPTADRRARPERHRTPRQAPPTANGGATAAANRARPRSEALRRADHRRSPAERTRQGGGGGTGAG